MGGHNRKPSLAVSASTAPTPMPWKSLLAVLTVACVEPIAASVVLPIVVSAVRDTKVTDDPERIGYYAGLLDGIFFLCEALLVLHWSRLSDRIGRKPILCVGLSGIGMSMVAFGFAKSFPGLLAARALAGSLSANISVVKSTLGELLDDTNKARGFALLASTWPIACIVGPLIGGALAHPAHNFPSIFGSPFWERYPFALPCLVSAGFAVFAALVALIFLEEVRCLTLLLERTLPSKAKRPSSSAYTLLASDGEEKIEPQDPPAAPPSLRTLIASRSVRVAILTYALLAGIDLAYIAIFVLFANSGISSGGLALTERQIGIYLAACGLLTGFVQSFGFAPLYKRFGVRRLYQMLIASWGVPFLLMPLINLAARHDMHVLSIGLLIFMLAPLSFGAMTYSTSFLIVNESAGPLALGAVNGLAQTCISTMRAFAPTAASAFYAFTNERNCLWLTYATFAAWALLSAFAGSLIRSEAYSGTSRMGSSDELEALAPETQEMLEVTKVKQESSTP